MDHSQGTWEISKHATPEHSPQYGIYATGKTNDLCTVHGEQAEANALLIAAAPELLAACEGISSGPSYEWGRILKSFLAVPMIPKELAHLLEGLIVTMDDIGKRAADCEAAIAKATT